MKSSAPTTRLNADLIVKNGLEPNMVFFVLLYLFWCCTKIERVLQIKYQIIRNEYGKDVVLMNCDFEDKEQFKLIAQSLQYKILLNGKDVTAKYRAKKQSAKTQS